MRLAAVPVLAMLAALVGAPPPASAASNLLHSPAATPAAGTVETSFRLHVEYLGVFPATSVEAKLAELSVPMTLVAGSPRDGAWEASVVLPPGTWPVTFAATAERGMKPTIAGPAIIVTGSATVPRAPALAPVTAEPGDPGAPDGESDDVERVSRPRTLGAATPVPAPRDTAAPRGDQPGNEDATVAPSSGPASEAPAAPSSPSAGPSTAGGDGSDRGGVMAGHTDGAENAAHPSAKTSSAPAPTGPATSRMALPASATGALDSAGGEEPRAAVEDVVADAAGPMAVWAAVLLVVSAAMLGVVARRRRDGAAEAEAMAAASAEAILERRAMRRARRPMPDDPIIAALGLEEDELRRRAARGISSDEDAG